MFYQAVSKNIRNQLNLVVSSIRFTLLYGLMSLLCFGCDYNVPHMPKKHINKFRVILGIEDSQRINRQSLKNAALELFPKGTAYETIKRYLETEVNILDMEIKHNRPSRFVYAKHPLPNSNKKTISILAKWGSFPYYSHLYVLSFILNEKSELEEVRSSFST